MTKLALLVGFALALTGAPVAAQSQAQPPTPPPGRQPPLPPADRPISAGEVQKLFDAWTLMQAQDALRLSEAQYGRFVTRLKALQDSRRRHQQVRNQILVDLRRLTNPETGTADESLITARLKAFRDEEDRAAGEIRTAYDGVDETLDVRQQARFRLFEERMEQQKLELLMRVRQTARSQRGRQ